MLRLIEELTPNPDRKGGDILTIWLRQAASICFVLLLAASCSAQDMLAAHNAVRATLKIAPLTWSDKLARQAQEWADKLIARKQFIHRPNNAYGENIFEIDGASASPKQVIENWASESAGYDYATNRCRKVCGHYTQIVWSATKQVGCGVAHAGRREVWVCNYDPPGNWAGQRPY